MKKNKYIKLFEGISYDDPDVRTLANAGLIDIWFKDPENIKPEYDSPIDVDRENGIVRSSSPGLEWEIDFQNRQVLVDGSLGWEPISFDDVNGYIPDGAAGAKPPYDSSFVNDFVGNVQFQYSMDDHGPQEQEDLDETLDTTDGIPILEYSSKNPDLYSMFKLEQAGLIEAEKTWLGTYLYSIRTELAEAIEYCKKFDYKNADLCMEEVESGVKALREAIDWAQAVKDEKEYVPDPEDDEQLQDGQAGTP